MIRITEITFDEWEKLNFKIGEVVEAKDHPHADKLYVLGVDIGEENLRTIVASIKEHYEKADLVGKKIVVFTNLKPVKFRGVESCGMLLAAEDDGKCVLLTPEEDIKNGYKVR